VLLFVYQLLLQLVQLILQRDAAGGVTHVERANTGKDPLESYVLCLLSEELDAPLLARLIDSVRMVKGDMSARCGKATYFVKNDLVALQTHPIIWNDENQITGDSIRIRMEDKQIRSMWVKNRAMAISRVDTALPNRFNQLTGKELTMYFRANKLERVDVQKNATSLYYLFDNKEPNGANKSSGDRIFIDFLAGDVDRIKIVGGVLGQYLPEKMIFKHEQDYNLDGFRWYENRPIRLGVLGGDRRR